MRMVLPRIKILLLALLTQTSCHRAASPAHTESKQELLFASGARLTVQYPYEYNRNALKTLQPADSGWVALTQTGTLLRFDAAYHLLNENTQQRYTCLTATPNGSLFAATADGRIHTIHPKSLTGTETAKVPGFPLELLIDRTANTLIAILATDGNRTATLAWDVPANRGYQLTDDPTTFHIDKLHQLWIGADHGEWGGSCQCLNLETGKTRAIKSDEALNGIYGFTELSDGTLLAYGGTSHFSLHEANVFQIVDNVKLKSPYTSVPFRTPPPRDQLTAPELPITHIVPLKNGKLAVLAYSDAYLVDRAFQHWQHLATLNLQYVPGRPDAMSAYPAMKDVFEAPAGSQTLIGASVRDGLIEIKDGATISHAMPGQIDLHKFRIIGRNEIGAIFGSDNTIGMSDLMLLHNGQIDPLTIALPDPPAGKTWRAISAIKMTLNEQVAVADLGELPGRQVILRWRDGKCDTLFDDIGRLRPKNAFETPDGRLWQVDGSALMQLVQGKWHQESTFPKGIQTGFKVITQNERGPWRLIGNGSFWLLSDDPGKTPTLERLDAKTDDGKTLVCRDAMEANHRTIFVATDNGMYSWDSQEALFTQSPSDHAATDPHVMVLSREFKVPPNPQCLCEDDAGNLWFAGEGLWCLPKNARGGFVGMPLQPAAPGTVITSMVDQPGGGVLAVTSEGALLKATLTPAPDNTPH